MIKNAIPLEQGAPQFYAKTFTILTTATGTDVLVLDNDSEFDLCIISATTDQDGTLTAATGPTQLPENFALSIKNLGSGRTFMNEFIRRGSICGVAFTNWTPEQRAIRFPKKAQLEISVQNLVGVTIVVQIVLKGYKVFNRLPGA